MKLTDNLYLYPENGMLDCNTYIIRGRTTIIVDPGSNQRFPRLIKDLEADGIKPQDIKIIVNTHLHIDHCWANSAIKEISGARLLLHPLQSKFYEYSVVETSRFFGLEPVEFRADGELEALDNIESISSPGHSPDSICFYSKERKFLACGDVIFNRNTGRVDLPGGSAEQLKQSIENLSRLEIEYLLPGHMDIVAGAENVKDNFAFVRKNIFPWL